VPTAIYVASPEGDTGKSTIALGILHRLAATVAKVGVFRPITRLGEDRDYILDLLLAHTTVGLPYEQCVGVSYQQLHDDPDAAIADIVDRYHEVADRCDAVVIVGSDYTDVTTPSELDTNARIAANLGAPIVLSVKARDRTPVEVAQVVELCLVEIAGQHAHTAAVIPSATVILLVRIFHLGGGRYARKWALRSIPFCATDYTDFAVFCVICG